MPIYKYFGYPAKFHGKPLFHILCHLKEFGKGRIVTRTSHLADPALPALPALPSFYRILWAQPLMDKDTLEGRVVAERVRRGIRYQEPVDLADLAPLPDFRLVAREEEEQVCRWGELREFDTERDTVTEPAHYTAPPLLKLLMERTMRERGEEVGEMLLPHIDTYIPKDTEKVVVADPHQPGRRSRERVRVLKHQEWPTRCSGVASYQYTGSVGAEHLPREEERVVATLPMEAPMPQPSVGMRLYKWADTHRDPRNHDELRTEQHNSFRP